VKKTSAFWDASALVPLCVNEAASRHARTCLRNFTPVVWWGSLVEIQSGICRLNREKKLTDAAKQGASARLRMLGDGWKEILPIDQVRELAVQLLEKYALRSADSMQLAASLIWCEERPAKRTFICGDLRLSEAAGQAGFSVINLVRRSS
jgi:predicted nucleic acid-binding protein